MRDDYFHIVRAFRALDPEGTGFIDAQRLRSLLTSDSCPDALSDSEAAVMAAFAADKKSGAIDYEAYALKLATDGRDL